MQPTFRILRHRFHFEAITTVYFPEYKAGNVLRGMAGLLLPRTAPAFAEQILNPTWAGAPSGFATPPKPFQFRAHHLDGRRIQPQDTIHIDVHQFAPDLPIRQSFEAAMKLLETEGLGPGRGRLRLLTAKTDEMAHELTPAIEATEVTLKFVTPTDLDPAFDQLIARLHERINALSTCYQGNQPLRPLEKVDIQIASDETRHIQRQRHSTRTSQTYETGGMIGPVRYVGPLTAAWPFLQLGQWTGVAGGIYEISPPAEKQPSKVINW